MDFFEAQAQARRRSAALLWVFAGLVLLVMLAVYAGASVGAELWARWVVTAPKTASRWWPWALALGVGGTLVAVAVRHLWVASHGGGRAVAESLGGRRVRRSTTDTAERRLLNVVDEMAIAAGVPVPQVYVLDQDHGINAFTAGASAQQAVVAVTQGALVQLSRDELQGVVAHEVGHIANGDVALNLRLQAVLQGLYVFSMAGRGLIEGASLLRRGEWPVLLGGAALWLVGALSEGLGRLLQAAVSREREYLADAAAVQFTRSRDGLAGALKRIAARSALASPARYMAIRHMLLDAGEELTDWLQTHPPLHQRIRRLDPRFTPDQLQPLVAEIQALRHPLGQGRPAPAPDAGQPIAFDSSSAPAIDDGPPAMRADSPMALLPSELVGAVYHPGGAMAMALAVLAPASPGVSKALALIEAQVGAAMAERVGSTAQALAALDASARLTLLDLALPALPELAPQQQAQLLDLVRQLIELDGRTSLFECMCQRLIHTQLRPPERRPERVNARTLRDDVVLLLAWLARAGAPQTPQATHSAWQAGLAAAPLDGPWPAALPADGLQVQRLHAVLDHLGHAAPLFRAGLMRAATATVRSDGRCTPTERALLRVVAQALDCPMPQ
jgi:Zn-dependent protease with chaperone function